jgi:FlaG/FlaF family flagellin (archaellin)
MKPRRDIRSNAKAISAVIGVILMVAVAVAMAAVAYAYFTGIIGESPKATPTFSFVSNEDTNTIIITQMEEQSNWQDLKIKEVQGSTEIIIQDQTGPKTGPISMGEAILIDGHGLTGAVDVIVVYIPTNTVVSVITFYDITA